MMRIGPLIYVFFAFVSPAAIGIYFLVSTLWRVGQQAFITRSLYGGEESIGVQAQKAMAELREVARGRGATAPEGARRRRTPRRRPRSTGTERQREDVDLSPRPGAGPTTQTATSGTALQRPSRTPGPARRRRGSSAVEWVVTTGRTVAEATEAALDQLGVDEQDAEIEVVQEPQKGLFGRLRAEAQVRARVRPTAPPPEGRPARAPAGRPPGRDGDRSRAKKVGLPRAGRRRRRQRGATAPTRSRHRRR